MVIHAYRFFFKISWRPQFWLSSPMRRERSPFLLPPSLSPTGLRRPYLRPGSVLHPVSGWLPPTEPVRSTTGPCVTPYPVPTRRVRIPSPPPGIAVRTAPQVCITQDSILFCSIIHVWLDSIILSYCIYTLILIMISRRSFVTIAGICWLKRKINSYNIIYNTLYIHMYIYFTNIATPSIPPLNAIKIKVNKHQRKTPRRLKIW